MRPSAIMSSTLNISSSSFAKRFPEPTLFSIERFTVDPATAHLWLLEEHCKKQAFGK